MPEQLPIFDLLESLHPGPQPGRPSYPVYDSTASPEIPVVTEEQIRTWLSQLETGADCPCCGRPSKIYKRKLNTIHAISLRWLASEELRKPGQWVNVPETAPRNVLKGGGEYAKLQYWQLIEQLPNEDPSKKTSGCWRITPAGMAFVRGEFQIPSHVYLLNGEVRGFTSETTTLSAALGEPFDFAQLMNAI